MARKNPDPTARSDAAAAGRRTPEPSSDPVLDGELVAMLNEMLSPEDRSRILGQAETQLEAIAAGLRQAWNRHDLPAVQLEAHKLAGLAGTAGCVAVLRTARAIEEACEPAQPGVLAERFADLDAAVPAGIVALRRWRLGGSGSA